MARIINEADGLRIKVEFRWRQRWAVRLKARRAPLGWNEGVAALGAHVATPWGRRIARGVEGWGVDCARVAAQLLGGLRALCRVVAYKGHVCLLSMCIGELWFV